MINKHPILYSTSMVKTKLLSLLWGVIIMDQVKIGKFIAQCRNEKNITQEKLGVTNKTTSRWKNGHYLPDIEMMH